MDIITTGRGELFEVSRLTDKAIANLNRDGLTRAFDAAEYGVYMWDVLQDGGDVVRLTVQERRVICKKEFGISWEQAVKYLKVSIALLDDDIQDEYIKHSFDGMEVLFKHVTSKINLRDYITGKKPLPF